MDEQESHPARRLSVRGRLRVGDPSRERAVGVLKRAVARGQLSSQKFEDRVGIVYAATVRDDLKPALDEDDDDAPSHESQVGADPQDIPHRRKHEGHVVNSVTPEVLPTFLWVTCCGPIPAIGPEGSAHALMANPSNM